MNIITDARHAARSLARSRFYAPLALALIVLAIGANTATLAIVEAMTRAWGPGAPGARPVWALAAAALLLLVVVFLAVTHMALDRAASRRREFAIRRALGAGPAQIMSLMLVESLFLAAGGGSLGIVVGYLGVRAMTAWTSIPGFIELMFTPATAGLALLLAVSTGLIFGIAPAVYATRIRLHDTLKQANRTAPNRVPRAFRRALLAGVAVSLVFVVMAGVSTGRHLLNRKVFDHTCPG